MHIEDLSIPGCRRLTGLTTADDRGSFAKLFSSSWLGRHALGEVFVSESDEGVLRGLHMQEPPYEQHKLVSCLGGRAYDVVVDLRRGSPTEGRLVECELDAGNATALWLPPGVAHGFLALTPATVMLYCTTSPHSPEHDSGVRWDSVGASWPAVPAVISARDRGLQPFEAYESPFAYE
jgi:dTDP-4-dehydrorhamnose 3,5-epimerase